MVKINSYDFNLFLRLHVYVNDLGGYAARFPCPHVTCDVSHPEAKLALALCFFPCHIIGILSSVSTNFCESHLAVNSDVKGHVIGKSTMLNPLLSVCDVSLLLIKFSLIKVNELKSTREFCQSVSDHPKSQAHFMAKANMFHSTPDVIMLLQGGLFQSKITP